MAYSETANKGDLQRFWAAYFENEKEIYAELLKNPDEVVEGTVKELAEKYNIDIMTMVGFLDGINDSLVEANPIDDMEEVEISFNEDLVRFRLGEVEIISKYNIVQYLIRYLSRPTPIILVDLNDDLTINGIKERTECILNPVVHRAILDRAVKLALQSKATGK